MNEQGSWPRPLFRLGAMGTCALALALAACGPMPEGGGKEQPQGAAQVGSSEQELYVSSPTIWTSLNVPVCWENATTGNATGRGWVQDAITNSWELATDVNFTGWGDCTFLAPGIHIKIEDTTSAPHTVALGSNLSGTTNGMALNFTFNNWSTACQGQEEFCTRAIAVHEFGHALGFAHEQNRPDTPATCTDAPQGSNGDILAGPWDLNSVMNYCSPNWNNNGALSAGDTKNSRQYYGSPTYVSTKKDAVDWGNGKIYFFNGSEYTRYDWAADKVDNGYPKSIAAYWGNWPAGWTSIDAAIRWSSSKAYFFRGSEYIRYDIAADAVDPGYPKPIIGNWPGWPASWTSVDAAVRWNNGKAYFFRGSEYIRYDMALDAVDPGYPRLISGNWPGVWSSGIEYIVTPGNGKAYFFKGRNYLRYDFANDSTDPGYPVPIVGRWVGVPF